jgi:hypothetical protein
MRKWNKKGAVEEILEYFPDIILTIIVMTSIFLMVNLFLNQKLEVQNLQKEVFVGRVLYSPDSIMRTDNLTGKVYPGMIELEKFSNKTLEDSIKYSYERQLASKMTLYDVEGGIVKTVYYNSEWYNRFKPLADSNLGGVGGIKKYSKKIPINYIDKEKIISPGMLDIEVLIPR